MYHDANSIHIQLKHEKLEQLERLRSEIHPPPPPMITHTSDSHQIPNQNKTKLKQVKVTHFKKLPTLCKKLDMQHTFWSCLIRCINIKWIQPEPQSRHGM